MIERVCGHRHLAQPAARAGQGVGGLVLQLPTEARRFLAGAIAGALAKTGTAPLEKLRMSLMTSSTVRPARRLPAAALSACPRRIGQGGTHQM